MSWQDREYARGGSGHGPVFRTVGPTMLGQRSIVTILIMVNVGVFALEALFPPVRALLQTQFLPMRGIVRFGLADLVSDLVMRGQVWRLFTAQYLHAGMWHLFINMLVLHFLGRPLERMWSARKFFTIYTLCGLAGNLFFTLLGVLDWLPGLRPAVGASGCIYGLLGIVAVLFPHATVYIYFLFPIKIRTAAMIFAGLAVYSIWQRGANYGGEACHLAGMVFGVWWAMKGDSWWNRGGYARWEAISSRFGRRRSHAAASRGGFQAKVIQRQADAEAIDQILKKVYERGIHSLTEGEKRMLKDASERQRIRESHHD